VNPLTIVLPYYRNPGMLAHQYGVWADWPPAVKAAISIVLVDDGSPEAAGDVPRPAGLPLLRILRMLEDHPWHQHACRNLGAKVAAGSWLLLTDMDHVLPASSARGLLERIAGGGDVIYTFGRVDAPDLKPKLDARGMPHPHPNSFALRRDRFWAVGGYDEDLIGYGTDGFFRKRLFTQGPPIHLADCPLIRFSREVIPDASTRADRNAGRQTARNRAMITRKAALKLGPRVLMAEWGSVL